MSNPWHIRVSGPSPLRDALRAAAPALAANPRLTAAIVGALVAEGEAFAQTEEGRRARAAIVASPRFRAAKVLWDALGLARHRGARPRLLPGFWLDLLRLGADSPSPEEALSAVVLDAGGRAP